MPYAITHILLTVWLAKIARNCSFKDKKKFPPYYLLIAGFAGVLPDIDLIVYLLLSSSGIALEQVHRVFSHTLMLPLLFFILSIAARKVKERRILGYSINFSMLFWALSFGTLVHIFLDWLLIGPVVPFFPFSRQMYGLSLILKLPFSEGIILGVIMPSIDAILFGLWIIERELRHKISRFM